MNWRGAAPLLAAVLAVTAALPARAGHGFMNSFADIAPLPPAGTAPDSPAWPLERLQEQALQYFAATPALAVRQAERNARERLAEFLQVARAAQGTHTTRAAQAYREDMAQALAALPAGPGREALSLRRRLAQSLLEQQYLLSLAWFDIARPARAEAEALGVWMQASYAGVRTRLSRGVAESLFFKEEEARWSWEMAVRGEELEP